MLGRGAFSETVAQSVEALHVAQALRVDDWDGLRHCSSARLVCRSVPVARRRLATRAAREVVHAEVGVVGDLTLDGEEVGQRHVLRHVGSERL